MKHLNYLTKLILSSLLLMYGGLITAQSTLSGIVTNTDGEPLIGANLIVEGTTDGAVSGFDGSFSIITSASFPLDLSISYTGFNSQTITLQAPSSEITIALEEGIIAEEVVVSASRKREKVQEAPASISVLTSRVLEATPQVDPARTLINLPGVSIQQQSAARINIELRAAASLFSTSTFPIKDYRSLVGPGVGTFQTDQAGLNLLDIERIEVVRGPGSALYGPGVSSGVIHFLTKSPIDYPGTSVQLYGGELATFGGFIRHAGANEKKTFGYKINAAYNRGDEFTLDPDDPDDKLQIAKFRNQIVQPAVTNGIVDLSQPGTVLLTQEELDPDGDGNMMQDDYNSFTSDLTLEFRPAEDLNITLASGYTRVSSVFYNDLGEGLSQNEEIWSQARVQKGGFFGQVFYVNNNGGSQSRPTLLYQSGNRSPVGRQQLESQLQYNFEVPGLLNSDWTVGFDYRLAKSDTENLVYGRQEDDDDFSIIGTYLQTKFELGSKLDLVLAGRYDKINFLDDGNFAPRVAFVFKPSPEHTIRASYNKSSRAPTALEYNIDFPVNAPVPGLFDFWLRGQHEIQTFTNPVIDVSIPGVPDLPVQTPGFPLAIAYGAVTPTLLQTFGALVGQEVLPGVIFTPQQFALLQGLLTNPANVPTGFSGQLVGVNAFDQTLMSLTNLTPTNPSQVAITNSYEIGYKGLIADKFGVMLDIYHMRNKGTSDFTQIGPIVQLVGENIAGDLGDEVSSTIQPQIQNILLGLGLDPVSAATQAAIFGALLAQSYEQAGAAFVAQTSPLYPIFGAVESDQVPKDDEIVHVPTGYRIFQDTELNYWGIDFGLEYYISDDLSIFGNYSWLDQTDFPASETGEPVDAYINTPKNKFRIGLNYLPAEGWRGNVSFQHDDSFYANFGQFSGFTQEKNLVDFGLGYKFSNGLALDVAATNLFDNEYRAFNNFPKIGRRILGKLTYSF